MPFLSPNQQCQSTEGKISHFMDLLTPSWPGGLPTLSVTTNSSWLPWGRVAMPLISWPSLHRQQHKHLPRTYWRPVVSASYWDAADIRLHLPSTYLPRAMSYLPFPRRVEGWVDLGTAGKVYTARAQGCISQWLCDKHNCPQRDSIPGPLALQSGMLLLDHCDLPMKVEHVMKLNCTEIRWICAMWG